MRNKWKLAFWICFVLFIITGLTGLYSTIDQGVTITYMKDGYEDTESDLKTIINIAQSSNQTKNEIRIALKNHKLYEFMDFENDTISLERISLIFKNDTLQKIEKQW